MLRQTALEAIILHNHALSRLAIAKLQNDRPKIRALEPMVERLFEARCVAVGVYQKHIDTTHKSQRTNCHEFSHRTNV
jgi:hypothetical protein